jgi:hypothetical protein
MARAPVDDSSVLNAKAAAVASPEKRAIAFIPGKRLFEMVRGAHMRFRFFDRIMSEGVVSVRHYVESGRPSCRPSI